MNLGITPNFNNVNKQNNAQPAFGARSFLKADLANIPALKDNMTAKRASLHELPEGLSDAIHRIIGRDREVILSDSEFNTYKTKELHFGWSNAYTYLERLVKTALKAGDVTSEQVAEYNSKISLIKEKRTPLVKELNALDKEKRELNRTLLSPKQAK